MGENRLEERRRILVVGDAMIDRSWIIAAAAETSQKHAEVDPKKVVDPNLPNVRPGGAGMTAAWLAWDARNRVQLLASGGPDLKILLDDAQVDVFPDMLDTGKQTTTKFRIYADQGSGRTPSLLSRYDLDIISDTITLPAKFDKPDMLVVADFCKGAITSKLLSDLSKLFPDIPWMIDSKDPGLVKQAFSLQLRQRPTLFVNRSEFARLCALLFAEFRDGTFLDGRWHHIEEQLLKAARAFHADYERWDLVVKLDRDGSVAYWMEDGDWKSAYVAATTMENVVGIGAGDAFLAGWVSAGFDEHSVTQRLAAAGSLATAWIEKTESTRHLATPGDVSKEPRPSHASPAAETVQARLGEVLRSRSLEVMIERGLVDLSRAAGHCGRFMTLNPELGATVRHFAHEVRTFFKSAGARRPLNCLVWAAPGSGKSFLVEEVAHEVGAEFHEINVSALPDLHELKNELAKAGGKDKQEVLVLIDECGTTIQGRHIFPSLLAPLWTRPTTKKIAFVLVDSQVASKNVDDFASWIARKEDVKGPDLVSRINGPRITLSAPDPTDRAILVASLVRRTHAKSAFAIEAAALRALVADPTQATWSPRAVEYIIEAVVPSGSAVKFDDLVRARQLCDRMHMALPPVIGANHLVQIHDTGGQRLIAPGG